MTHRIFVTNSCLAVTLLVVAACDKPVEAAEETPTPVVAAVQADASLAVGSHLDLEAVVARVSSGEVTSAAELEAELEADAVAHVDIDADGKRDELRIVERRVEKKAVFEIHAVPSSKVEVDIEAAPVIAELEIEARADAGNAVARASYSASFATSVHVDVDTSYEHTFTGVVVTGEGRMHVEADANVFVAWAFRPARPVYVAEVFVVHHVEHDPDPCWPPGHCKHGFWKATGHHDRHDDAHVDVSFSTGHKEVKHGHMHGKVVVHDKGHGGKSSSSKHGNGGHGGSSKGSKAGGGSSKGSKAGGGSSKGGGSKGGSSKSGGGKSGGGKGGGGKGK